MEEFDPTSIGAVAVADYVDSGTDRTGNAVLSDFDPASIGAVPVDEQFDPRSLGAVPVEQDSGFVASFKGVLSSNLAKTIAAIQDVASKPFLDVNKSLAAGGDAVASEQIQKNLSLMGEAGLNREASKLTFEGASPESTNVAAQLGRGAASVASMVPAMTTGAAAFPLMALQGAGEAYESTLASGGTEQEAQKAMVKTAPHLLLYLAGGKLASGLATKLLGKEASTLARGLTGAGLATVSNVATSSVIRALEAPKGKKLSAAIPTIETLTADTLFGVYHGVGEYRNASLEAKRRAYTELQDRGFSKEEIRETVAEPKAEAVVEKSPEQMVVESAAPPAGAPAAEVPKVTEPSPVKQSVEQVSPAAPRIVSTGIMTPEGIATYGEWNTKHADIIKNSETIKLALAEGMDPEALDANKGFIVEENGKQRFVGRKEALEIARKSGQVDESVLYSPEKQGLISEALIEPKGEPNAIPIKSTNEEVLRNAEPGREPRVELRQVVEGDKGQKAPAGKEEGKVEQAANELQQYRTQAIEAARQAGATDPELAASVAQQQSAEKGNTDPALFIETARRRGLDQLKATKPTVSEEEAPEATVERGPRAETISQEDISAIDQAVNKLPEVQRNIIRELEKDPNLTDQQIGSILNLTIDQVKKAKAAFRKTLQSFIEEEGIGVSMGPGAASANEILVRYELRKFSKRFDEDQSMAEEVRRATGGRYYEPIPNKVTAEQAVKLIEERGEEVIRDQIKDESSGLSYADRVTVGEILIKRWNERYKSLKESNPEEASKALDEASGLGEWAAEYGTRLGQGVQSFAMWNRLTPAGKLRSFKRVVQKVRTRHKSENRTEVEEIKDVLNGEGTKGQKVQELTKLAKKNKVARKVKKDFGKLARLEGKVTDEKFYETLSDRLGLPKFDETITKEIMRLAQRADEAPEGMPKQEAIRDLNTYIAQQKGFDWTDLPFGMYYGNILSGLNTQAVNLVDTALNVKSEVLTLMMTDPRAASAIMSGALRGASEGRWDAMLALTEGRRISDGKLVEDPFFMEISKFGKKGGVPISQGTRMGRVTKFLAETPMAKFLNAYKFVGRAMSASDTLAFRTAQEGKSAQLAWRLANEEGVNGDALRTRMDEILGYDRLEDFRKQASLEGFTGKKAEARAFELMELSRPEELQKASRDFASESTYNYKPYGVMGSISNRIEEFSRDYKVFKLVVPFTRIVANVTNRGLNNTPYGYVRAYRGKAGRGRAEKIFTPEEQQALNVRATMGTVALSALLILHESGAIQISGQGPSDAEKKRQLKETGWKPYSIKVGDTHYSYAYTPVGLGVAIMGNILDSIKYNDFSQKDALGVGAYALSSVGSTLFNQSFLSSLSKLFDILAGKSPAQQIAGLKSWASSTAASLAVPFASFTKDMESLFSDPNLPKTDTFAQALVSSIPFASQGLKPQLNAFGQPIKSSRNRFWRGETNDPVWKMVADKQLRVPVASNFFDDPDQNYEYTKRSGQRLRTWMETAIPMLRNMERKSAQDAIERQADYIRSIVRSELMSGGARKKVRQP